MKKRSIKVMLASLLAVPVMAFAMPVMPVMAQDCNGSGGISAGADCSQGTDQPDNLFGAGGIFQTIVNVLLFLIGAVSVIMLIYGGIRYTISGGDSKAVTDAKNTILYAIVGIIVAIMAYAIVNFVIGSFIPSA